MTDVDSSLLLFCKAVKKDFKVALSGECADEIFGGYPWYHNKNILFEDTFPWSRSLDIRHSILKNGLLKMVTNMFVKDTLPPVKVLKSLTAKASLIVVCVRCSN